MVATVAIDGAGRDLVSDQAASNHRYQQYDDCNAGHLLQKPKRGF